MHTRDYYRRSFPGKIRETALARGNPGWNLGRVAGAGIEDHVHLHVVPRWNRDANFMPVLADVKVLPARCCGGGLAPEV